MGGKFIEYIGCLARRGDLFNHLYHFKYQPFESFKFVWKDINHYFILDENPQAWHYVFHVKLGRALREWRSSMKKYFNGYDNDWERFWHLETRIDPVQFAALCYSWETEDSQAISKINSDNRNKVDCDHHLGRRSYAQMQYKNGKPMQLNELARASYGNFHPNYQKEDKKRKNLKMLESLDTSFAQATQKVQEVEGPDAILSPEDQQKVIDSILGPSKKNRVRFVGDGVRKVKTSSSSEDSINTSNTKMIFEMLNINKKNQEEIQTLKLQNELLWSLLRKSHPEEAQRIKEKTIPGSLDGHEDVSNSQGEENVEDLR